MIVGVTEWSKQVTNRPMKLYNVTFTDGRTVPVRASSPYLASCQVSTNHGTDIKGMELVAVDADYTGKEARKVARLANVPTRHMTAFPAKVVSRYVLNPAHTVQLVSADNHCVKFRTGGAY